MVDAALVWFSAKQVHDPLRFAHKLRKQSDPVSALLWQKLPEPDQIALRSDASSRSSQRAAVKAASVRAIRKGLALTASTGAHAAAMGCRGGSRPCNPATRSSGEVQERQAPAGVAGASPRVVPSPPAASPFRNTDGITSGAAGALCRYPAGVAAGDQTCLASDAANLSIASLTHRSFCSSLSALPAP